MSPKWAQFHYIEEKKQIGIISRIMYNLTNVNDQEK